MPTSNENTEPGDDEQVKAISVAWMHHLGYPDAQIADAEKVGHQNSGCEFEYPNWNCEDENGYPRHPEMDALIEASEMANVAIEALAALTFPASDEAAWRKAIADQVRRNCTPSNEAYQRGGDTMIYAVADWIENPPDWSHFASPAPLTIPAGKAEPVSREEIMKILDPAGDDRHGGHVWAGMTLHQKQAEAIADALLAAFSTLTPEPVLPKLDPEPFVSQYQNRYIEPWSFGERIEFTFAPRPEFSQNLADY